MHRRRLQREWLTAIGGCTEYRREYTYHREYTYYREYTANCSNLASSILSVQPPCSWPERDSLWITSGVRVCDELLRLDQRQRLQ